MADGNTAMATFSGALAADALVGDSLAVRSPGFDIFWPQLVSQLNAALAPTLHHQWMQQFLRFVPRAATDYLGFEARLGAADGPTDCALNLSADAIGWLTQGVAGAPTPIGSEWDRIRAFLSLWAESGTPPLSDMTRVWLEFDMAAAPALRPNLMFGYWPRGHEPLRTRAWLIDQAIATALGAPLPPATHALLEAGLDACAEADDFQIGLMTARALPAVRLCVFDLPDGALLKLASAIGWRGDVDRVAALVAALRPHADFVGLHFDLAGEALPRVGIEPGFTASSWRRQPHLEPRWAGQFDVLEAAGALTPTKRAALMAWPGHGRVMLDGRPVALLRGLSHVKLVLHGDGATEAKGYFGLAIRDLAQANPGERDAAAA